MPEIDGIEAIRRITARQPEARILVLTSFATNEKVFPAVKAVGEGFTTKIFYLTARTTGRFAAEHALEELRGAGLKLKSLTITAKDKTCFNPDSACNPDECEFARGHYDRINEALNDIFNRQAFTAEVGCHCRGQQVHRREERVEQWWGNQQFIPS